MVIMRGRVTVYSILGCPHCLKAKATLRENGLPFIDVSIDQYHRVREWLNDTTGKTSVPQIFFNSTHIGGNDDLNLAFQDKTRWKQLIHELENNEWNEDHLYIPTPSDRIINSDNDIRFHCERDPIADLVDELIASGVPRTHSMTLFSKSPNAFSGLQFIEWYCKTQSADEDKAVDSGYQLLEKKFILPLKSSTTGFEGDKNIFYRINDSIDTSALNSGSVEGCFIDDAIKLGETLRNTALMLFNEFLTDDGKSINYAQMKESSQFQEFVRLTYELQRAPIERLDESSKKSFFINIYNVLVIHATVVSGPPANWFTRLRFFQKTSYIIGGQTFSLNDIENGVLRANKRGVLQIFPPFKKSDPRRIYSLTQVDPRIHFALNCGAKSCPPIKTFSAQNIDEELQLATAAYLETDEGLVVNKSKSIVYLSSLFQWYASDFGKSGSDILNWISLHVQEKDKKDALDYLINATGWKISYLTYDWSSNSSS